MNVVQIARKMWADGKTHGEIQATTGLSRHQEFAATHAQDPATVIELLELADTMTARQILDYKGR